MKYYEVTFATKYGAEQDTKTYRYTNAADAAGTIRRHKNDLSVYLDIVYPTFRQHILEKNGTSVYITPGVKLPKSLAAAVNSVK